MQLNKFKTILQQEKENLMVFIKNHHHDIDFDGDETDEIQAKIIARAAAQILVRKQEKLTKIETALKKIGTGNFGTCESCGEDIAEKRLLFNPGFNTCVICAEELETLKKNQIR